MTDQQIKTYISNLYSSIASELQSVLPTSAPKMAHTSGTKFWGRIRKYTSSGAFLDIRINTPLFIRLFRQKGFGAFNEKLVDTICHEFAHMTYWNHGGGHILLTDEYTQMILKAVTEAPKVQVAASPTTTKIQLSDLVADTTKARKQLRKANIQKPGTNWEWSEVPADVKKVLGL